MDTMTKLRILSDAAKYDAACTSSGLDKKARPNGMGATIAAGCCHSFAADGRCISLLKVLLTNVCVYDCAYCVNRVSHDTERAAFTPRELADLTMNFYRRNYIEGLFLSSGVAGSADATTERMIECLRILREEYNFAGYIHAKAIPGADRLLIERLGFLADRMSVNIELPSGASLVKLAPQKSKQAILGPMGYIQGRIGEASHDIVRYRHAPRFAPAGQSTQLIVGASPERDRDILQLTEGLYRRYELKRVFYSAYVPVVENPLLPPPETKPPLWREHRLYQADWLLRFYGFEAKELLSEEQPDFHPFLDPKCLWALLHPELFPLEVNRASQEELLRVPGIGVKSAIRIVRARRAAALSWDSLAKVGIVMKRAAYFLLCKGKRAPWLVKTKDAMLKAMMSPREQQLYLSQFAEKRQLSLFADETPALTAAQQEVLQCLPPTL